VVTPIVVDKPLFAEGMAKAFPEGKPPVPAIANDEPAALIESVDTPTPEQVATAKEVLADPTTSFVPLGASALELQADMSFRQDAMGNRLVPLDSIPKEIPVAEESYALAGETILVSPIAPDSPQNEARLGRDGAADPFPEIGFAHFDLGQRQRIQSSNGAMHGGFFRDNPDGTISFKPTSYVGPIVTGTDRQAIANQLG
jgi:hypothetical protein